MIINWPQVQIRQPETGNPKRSAAQQNGQVVSKTPSCSYQPDQPSPYLRDIATEQVRGVEHESEQYHKGD